MGGVPKEKIYSEFWSNREYIFVTRGEKLNNSVPSVVRKKLSKVAKGFREVTYPESIDDTVLADLIDGLAHVLSVKGYDEYSNALYTIAKAIKEQAIEGIIKKE